MAKKKKPTKKGGSKAAGGATKYKVELHLPQELYDRVKLMKPEDVAETLRILFDCNAPGANIFGATDAEVFLAKPHASSDERIAFDPFKVCNGP